VDKLLTPLTSRRRKDLTRRATDPRDRQPVDPTDIRSRQERDRDRILYSAALHRLAYITQVTAPELGHTFHNRLTHSLKVAQVGRRNAERLGRLVTRKEITGAAAELVRAASPDSVEASCLAHDLGHPPFGHIAEEALQHAAREHAGISDGFEGNAQSFRIVTRLAVRSDGHPGLDLTRQTLDGLLKYPWRHWPRDPHRDGKRERKWGYYLDDTDAFTFAREPWPEERRRRLPERSFEAELMDWADDVTYAVHDVDDFFRAGLVPLDRLGQSRSPETRNLLRLLTDAEGADPQSFPSYEPERLVDALQKVIANNTLVGPYTHTVTSRAAMREFGSKLIGKYLDAFSVENDLSSRKVRLRIDEEAELEVTALKMLVMVYVVHRPSLAVVQHGQQRLISDLFEWYFRASSRADGDHRLFPPGAKERLGNERDTPENRARVVIDLVSGLTERAAVELHRGLCDGSAASALDATALIG